jgi:hypothetical protein
LLWPWWHLASGSCSMLTERTNLLPTAMSSSINILKVEPGAATIRRCAPSVHYMLLNTRTHFPNNAHPRSISSPWQTTLSQCVLCRLRSFSRRFPVSSPGKHCCSLQRCLPSCPRSQTWLCASNICTLTVSGRRHLRLRHWWSSGLRLCQSKSGCSA